MHVFLSGKNRLRAYCSAGCARIPKNMSKSKCILDQQKELKYRVARTTSKESG